MFRSSPTGAARSRVYCWSRLSSNGLSRHPPNRVDYTVGFIAVRLSHRPSGLSNAPKDDNLRLHESKCLRGAHNLESSERQRQIVSGSSVAPARASLHQQRLDRRHCLRLPLSEGDDTKLRAEKYLGASGSVSRLSRLVARDPMGNTYPAFFLSGGADSCSSSRVNRLP